MSSQFGNPNRPCSLGGAMLGGAGRSLNRSGSMNAPTNEGMIKAAKAVTTSMIKSSSTGGPPIRDSSGYSRPATRVRGHGFQAVNSTQERAT
jgi:hypothetical protein